MYYTIECEGLREFLLFRRYDEACSVALELARSTPHEVRVVRLETSGGFGRQLVCVYNCKYEPRGNPPTNRFESDESI